MLRKNNLPPITDEMNVALWGTSGSGKTWLLHALAKELMWYTQNDPEFNYTLVDEDQQALFPFPPDTTDVGGTLSPEDRMWVFKRVGKINSRAHQISSHEHKIIVHDDMGRNLVDAISPGNEGLTAETLKHSPNLILLLDPSTVKGSGVGPDSDSNRLEKHEYAQYMHNLINTLQKKGGTRRLAVCLSKADLLKVLLPIQELVKAVFGADVMAQFRNPNLQVEYFRVSAVGYLKQPNGREVPNLDTSGNIREKDAWDPFNVVSPFFWIFESIERERVQKGDFLGDRGRSYIPYPKPRRK